MTYETQALLLDLGISYWLTGFQTVGEAIDIARTNLCRPDRDAKNYYDILSEKYSVDRHRISNDIQRTVGIAWREHRTAMENVLGETFERPPSPRKFVYAAAGYLNEHEGR